jgi:arylsulfatase A-like enzyme
MLIRNLIKILSLWLGLLGTTASFATDRPNIIYFVANDLGWKDVGFHGGRAITPNIDRLAENGARLENFYTLPYSSSARAALLTGRYPIRTGFQMLSIQPWSDYGLAPEERTLPEALAAAGYKTGLFGSWLLGHSQPEYLPNQKGFDVFYGNLVQVGNHYEKKNIIGQADWFSNEKLEFEVGFNTDLIAEKAKIFLDSHLREQPIFVLVSFPGPGAPYQSPDRYQSIYSASNPSERAYLGAVSQMDTAIGTIIETVEKLGQLENTVVVFHSDNGGAVKRAFMTGDSDTSENIADNGPFRSGQGSLYEGGVRVPLLINWKGKISPSVSTERIHVTDIFPTLINIGKGSIRKQDQVRPIDGIDISPVLFNQKSSSRNEILLNVDEFGGAILKDNWKLIVRSTLPTSIELYNIGDDPSEENDVVEKFPEISLELKKRLQDFAWEMQKSLYLDDLSKARQYDMPILWGDNPQRP